VLAGPSRIVDGTIGTRTIALLVVGSEQRHDEGRPQGQWQSLDRQPAKASKAVEGDGLQSSVSHCMPFERFLAARVKAELTSIWEAMLNIEID
jgi:hypothetical protein